MSEIPKHDLECILHEALGWGAKEPQYMLIQDLDTNKYLHLDIRWRISWVKDKRDATPLENNKFYFDWLVKKGLTTCSYLWHRCDKNGYFI